MSGTLGSQPATFEEEEWTAEDACIIWRLDPLTGNHAPVLDFPYKVKMTGELEVTVRAAKDIVFSRIGGGQRVIAELKLGSLKHQTDPVKFADNLATWEQKVDPLPITSETENLRVSVFHHSKHFAHAKMGSAYLPLSDLNNLMVTVKDTVGEDNPTAGAAAGGGESKSAVGGAMALLNEPTEQNPIPYFVEYPFVVDLRSRPTTDHAAVNGRSIAAGTLFWVVEKIVKTDEGTTINDGKNTFLRLADNAGWLFTTHQKDGRTIVRPSMQAREETEKEKQFNLIKQCQTWVEIINTKGKAVGKILLFCKLYIGSEREAVAGEEKEKSSKKLWKRKKRRKKKKDHKLFGGLLTNAVDSSSGEEIPKVCKDLIEFLRKFGLDTEGLFRVPGHHAEMQKIQDAYEKGSTVELKEVHDAAGVLKKFFRDLKKPIIPSSHNSTVLEIAEKKEAPSAKNEKYKFLFSTLPNVNKAVLAFIITFLHELSTHSGKNKMTVKNIAVVWAPNLFSPTCMQFSQMINAIAILIENCKAIFGTGVVENDTSGMRSLKMKRKHKRSQSSRIGPALGGLDLSILHQHHRGSLGVQQLSPRRRTVNSSLSVASNMALLAGELGSGGVNLSSRKQSNTSNARSGSPPPRPSSPHGANLRARLLRKSSALSFSSQPSENNGNEDTYAAVAASDNEGPGKYAIALVNISPRRSTTTVELQRQNSLEKVDELGQADQSTPQKTESLKEDVVIAEPKREPPSAGDRSNGGKMPRTAENEVKSEEDDQDPDEVQSMSSFSRRRSPGSVTQDEHYRLPIDRKFSASFVSNNAALGLTMNTEDLNDAGRYSTMTVLTRRSAHTPPPVERLDRADTNKRVVGGKSFTSSARSVENTNLGVAAAMLLGTNISASYRQSDGVGGGRGGGGEMIEASVASTHGDSVHSREEENQSENANSENPSSDNREQVSGISPKLGGTNPLNIVVQASDSVAATAGGGRDESSLPNSPYATGLSFDGAELAQRMFSDGKDSMQRHRSPSEEATRPSLDPSSDSPTESPHPMGKFLLARFTDVSSPIPRMSTVNSIAAVRDDESRMGEYSEVKAHNDGKEMKTNAAIAEQSGEKQPVTPLTEEHSFSGVPVIEETETVSSNVGTAGEESHG